MTVGSPAIDALRAALRDVPGLVVAFIFGSRAAGPAGPDRDLDLLVVTGPAFDRRAFYGRLNDVVLDVDIEVDLVRYRPEQMAERFADPAHPAHGFVRSVIDGPKVWLRGDADRLSAILGGTPDDPVS